jgi:OFA family oxalate/formate antiporter-like MFS transporter
MMTGKGRAGMAVAGACAAIFWPGAFIFSLPGVLGVSWHADFGASRAEVGRSLFFVLAGAGMLMFLVGRFQARIGTRRAAAAGALLTGGSTLFLGSVSGVSGVYTWAFLVGAASALIYLPGLTVVQQWHPGRRGLVSGLFNLCFGLSAAVMSPVFGGLLPLLGPGRLTLVSGAAALVCGLAVAPLLQGPGREERPEPAGAGAVRATFVPLTVAGCVRTRAFWCLWLTWSLAGAGGISMVVLSTAFGTSRGLSVQEAVFLLSAFNLTNGLGRFASGWLSDRLGRRRVMGVSFAVAGLAYWALPWLNGTAGWALMAALVGYAFGTLFAVSGPLASERFGLENFAAVFGMIFTAYGFVAGILGPWLSGVILDRTGGDFGIVFGYLGTFLHLAACMMIVMGPAPAARKTHPGP